MTDAIKQIIKANYSLMKYKDKSVYEWAMLWFDYDNDTFFEMFGFNFNPHKYPHLYEVAREEHWMKKQGRFS